MTDANDALLSGLKLALDQDPRNVALWIHYADLLATAERRAEAINALRTVLELKADESTILEKLVPLLRQEEQLAEALIRAERLLELNASAVTFAELARIHLARGQREEAVQCYARAREFQGFSDDELEAALQRDATADETKNATNRNSANAEARKSASDGSSDVASSPPNAADGDSEDEFAAAEIAPDGLDPDDWASQFDWGDLRVTFDDVAGLDDVKRQIHLRIIAPFKNKEIYRAFGRQGGGGILLYGPPGCGKTFIARATAGECGARFVSVGIHDIVDKYWGESEKLIHTLFDQARSRPPTVLFFDEFDALGSTRGRTESQFWKTLVDQLLQEMDGIGGRNEGVLVFAATNVPWHVDSAFRRPGRFDRVLFVPPPDSTARHKILEHGCKSLPGGDGIDVSKLAKRTSLMTGADLKALCERASENALERSLETGEVHPVAMKDFERELKRIQSSATDWLSTAKNYAKYSNESGQYDEVADFLRRLKRW